MEKTKSCLVVHPTDRSTDFLKVIYEKMENVTLVTGGKTKQEIKELIKEHDRCMFMGHGSPAGLFSVGKFPSTAYIIDGHLVDELKKKDNTVFIWCNADQFVNEHKLKGFYTKMFISEVGEAYYCGLPGTTQDIVDESNYGFVKMLSECINEPQEVMYNIIKDAYGELAESNPVAYYNWNRLCFNKP
jgi:hypothetical protein